MATRLLLAIAALGILIISSPTSCDGAKLLNQDMYIQRPFNSDFASSLRMDIGKHINHDTIPRNSLSEIIDDAAESRFSVIILRNGVSVGVWLVYSKSTAHGKDPIMITEKEKFDKACFTELELYQGIQQRLVFLPMVFTNSSQDKEYIEGPIGDNYFRMAAYQHGQTKFPFFSRTTTGSNEDCTHYGYTIAEKDGKKLCGEALENYTVCNYKEIAAYKSASNMCICYMLY